MNLDQLQAASRERHKGKSREFYLPPKLKSIKDIVTPFKEKQIKVKKIAAKINKEPKPIPLPRIQIITIDKSTLTISDLNFYEVPKGKLSKPKRRYQNRREALAKFEEKQTRIRQTAAKINATL